MSDFSFQGVTPDTILDAIESIGLYPTSGLLPLNSYENRVYQFLADDQKRYVVKFYRPQRWTDAQILEEHAFTEELAIAEIPVVCPLKLEGQTLHHWQGFRFSVFPSIGGRALEPEQLEQLEDLGRHLGRLHLVGSARPFSSRPALIDAENLTEAVHVLKNCPLIPDSLHVPFFTILDVVVARLKALDWTAYPTVRLHGDCHIGNLLWRPEGLTLVDFDDCRQGPAVQDLWMMLSGDRMQQQMQLETLVEGYEEFMPFDTRQLRLIEPLRAFRIIQYMAWLARRWEDPAFPHNFSWFAEARYWEQQILALKEQLAALDEAPLRLQPGFN
ncbi:serine/threonine protein kinase [Aliidiomarina sanyensis]|uniref:Stress response kinase A n=1 Tax=Aliidiomarina sanyensis TaxID=1249555 RepID=A0A432WBU7_9GAMM|nr:serine/threonine protein kinase [Aliidiomarina sanyensis]RUO29528.1 serine/threonine protein kinase [Aliidiomarina sanyensis]